MSLATYRSKRNFNRTSEPPPKRRSPKGNLFVVQKHAATRLHYDFRLQIGGVLASWAVPKGPSLDPSDKRLAVQTEDHPLEYANFEGTIPAGEYGAGTVAVWDQGRWLVEGDAAKSLKAGKLKFRLEGQRLHGGWTLVRLKNRNRRDRQANWLLIKERDAAAREGDAGEIVDAFPTSVLTDRTLEEIAAGKKPKRKRVASERSSTNRRSNGKLKRRQATRDVQNDNRASPDRLGEMLSQMQTMGAMRRPFPASVKAQLATATLHPPEGEQWLHELKLDGYRMFCIKRKGQVRLESRNQHDWTARMKPLVAAIERLPARELVLDGEVVVLDEQGVSSFQMLQNSFRGATRSPLVYYAFDLLYLDGHATAGAPLESRKRLLESLIVDAPASSSGASIRYSEHILASGGAFFKQACKMGLEGIISKRRDAPYSPGRGYAWLKSKCRNEQEFVIGGFTAPEGSRVGFGSLLMGEYRDSDELAYAGKVGTGFDAKTLKSLRAKLNRLKQPASPFGTLPRGISRRGVTWVRPELVAQVRFNSWTDDQILRQAAFLGLREDKSPRDVSREIATEPPKN